MHKKLQRPLMLTNQCNGDRKNHLRGTNYESFSRNDKDYTNCSPMVALSDKEKDVFTFEDGSKCPTTGTNSGDISSSASTYQCRDQLGLHNPTGNMAMSSVMNPQQPLSALTTQNVDMHNRPHSLSENDQLGHMDQERPEGHSDLLALAIAAANICENMSDSGSKPGSRVSTPIPLAVAAVDISTTNSQHKTSEVQVVRVTNSMFGQPPTEVHVSQAHVNMDPQFAAAQNLPSHGHGSGDERGTEAKKQRAKTRGGPLLASSSSHSTFVPQQQLNPQDHFHPTQWTNPISGQNHQGSVMMVHNSAKTSSSFAGSNARHNTLTYFAPMQPLSNPIQRPDHAISKEEPRAKRRRVRQSKEHTQNVPQTLDVNTNNKQKPPLSSSGSQQGVFNYQHGQFFPNSHQFSNFQTVEPSQFQTFGHAQNQIGVPRYEQPFHDSIPTLNTPVSQANLRLQHYPQQQHRQTSPAVSCQTNQRRELERNSSFYPPTPHQQHRPQMPPLIPTMNMPSHAMNSKDQIAYRSMLATYEQYSSKGIIPSPEVLAKSQPFQQQIRDKPESLTNPTQTSKLNSIAAVTAMQTLPSASTEKTLSAYQPSTQTVSNNMHQQYIQQSQMQMAMQFEELHRKQLQAAQLLQGNQCSPMQHTLQLSQVHQGMNTFRHAHPYTTSMTTQGTETIRAMLAQHPQPYRGSIPHQSNVGRPEFPTPQTDQSKRKRNYTHAQEKTVKTPVNINKSVHFSQHVAHHIQEATKQSLHSSSVQIPQVAPQSSVSACSVSTPSLHTAPMPCPPALVPINRVSCTGSPTLPISQSYTTMTTYSIASTISMNTPTSNVITAVSAAGQRPSAAVDARKPDAQIKHSLVDNTQKTDSALKKLGREVKEDAQVTPNYLNETQTKQKIEDLHTYRQMLPKLDQPDELPHTIHVPVTTTALVHGPEDKTENVVDCGTTNSTNAKKIASPKIVTESISNQTVASLPTSPDVVTSVDKKVTSQISQKTLTKNETDRDRQSSMNKRDSHACYLCRECFKEAKDIKHHINRAHWHWYNEPYVCKECLVIGKNWYDFQQHVYQVHRRAPPYQFIPRRILQIMYAMLIIPPGHDVPQLSACHMGKGALTPIMATGVEQEDTEKDNNSDVESKKFDNAQDALSKPSSPSFPSPPPLKELPKLQLLSSVEPEVLDKIKKAMETREVISPPTCHPVQDPLKALSPSAPQSSPPDTTSGICDDLSGKGPDITGPSSRRSSQENTKSTAMEIRKRIQEVKDQPLDNSPEAQMAKRIREVALSKLSLKSQSDSEEGGYSPKSPKKIECVDVKKKTIEQKEQNDANCNNEVNEGKKEVLKDNQTLCRDDSEQLFAEFKTKLWVAITIKLSCETIELKNKVNQFCESFEGDSEYNRRKLKSLLEGATLPYEKTTGPPISESDDNDIIIKLANRIIDTNKEENCTSDDRVSRLESFELPKPALESVARHIALPDVEISGINKESQTIVNSAPPLNIGTVRECDRYPSYTETINAVIEESRHIVEGTEEAAKKENSCKVDPDERKQTTTTTGSPFVPSVVSEKETMAKDNQIPKQTESTEEVDANATVVPDSSGRNGSVTYKTKMKPANKRVKRKKTPLTKTKRKTIIPNNHRSMLRKNIKNITPRIVLKSPSRKRRLRPKPVLAKSKTATNKMNKNDKNSSKKTILNQVFKKQEGTKQVKHHKIYERLLTRKTSDETLENCDSPQPENPLKSIFKKYGVDMDNPERVKWKESDFYEDAEKENNTNAENDDTASVTSVDSLVYFPEYQTEYEEVCPQNSDHPVPCPSNTESIVNSTQNIQSEELVCQDVAGEVEVSVSEIEVSTEGEGENAPANNPNSLTQDKSPKQSIPVVVLKRLTQKYIDKYSGSSETEDDEHCLISNRKTGRKARNLKTANKEKTNQHEVIDDISSQSANSAEDSDFDDVEFVIELENRPHESSFGPEYVSDTQMPFDEEVGANVIIGSEIHDSKKIDPIEVEKHAVYFCSICDFFNTQEKCVKSHMTRYHGRRRLAHKIIKKLWVKWQCLICDFITIEKEELEKHIKNSHISMETFVECPMCSQKESSLSGINDHMLMIHQDVPTAMKIVKKAEKIEKEIFQTASLCDRKSITKERYHTAVKDVYKLSRNNYINENIDIREEEFECMFCPFTIPSEYFIQLHARQHIKFQEFMLDTGEASQPLQALLDASYGPQSTLSIVKESKLDTIRASLDMFLVDKLTLVNLFGDSLVDMESMVDDTEDISRKPLSYRDDCPKTHCLIAKSKENNENNTELVAKDEAGCSPNGHKSVHCQSSKRILDEPSSVDMSVSTSDVVIKTEETILDEKVSHCTLSFDTGSVCSDNSDDLCELQKDSGTVSISQLQSDAVEFNREMVECSYVHPTVLITKQLAVESQDEETTIGESEEISIGPRETVQSSEKDNQSQNRSHECDMTPKIESVTSLNTVHADIPVSSDVLSGPFTSLEVNQISDQASVEYTLEAPNVSYNETDTMYPNSDNKLYSDPEDSARNEDFKDGTFSNDEIGMIDKDRNAERETNTTEASDVEEKKQIFDEEKPFNEANKSSIHCEETTYWQETSLPVLHLAESFAESPAEQRPPLAKDISAETGTKTQGSNPSIGEKYKDIANNTPVNNYVSGMVTDTTKDDIPTVGNVDLQNQCVIGDRQLHSDMNSDRSTGFSTIEPSRSNTKEMNGNHAIAQNTNGNKHDSSGKAKDKKRSKSSEPSRKRLESKPRKIRSENEKSRISFSPKIILHHCDSKEKSSTASEGKHILKSRKRKSGREYEKVKRKRSSATKDVSGKPGNGECLRLEENVIDRERASFGNDEKQKAVTISSNDNGKKTTQETDSHCIASTIKTKVKLDFSDALKKFKEVKKVNNKLAISTKVPADMGSKVSPDSTRKETEDVITSLADGIETKAGDNVRNVWDALKDMLA